MKTEVYEFYFNSIENNFSQGHYLANGKKLSFETLIKDDDIQNYFQILNPLAADIFDLAVAIYTADRMVYRKKNVSSIISINIQLRNKLIFEKSNHLNQLKDILGWFTNEYWEFNFKDKEEISRISEIQPKFSWYSHQNDVFILWSGGLDALAGLFAYQKELCNKSIYLIGIGANKTVNQIQRKLYEKTKPYFSGQDLQLIQLPFYHKAIDIQQKNQSLRTRGLVFQLIGAAVALNGNKDSLLVFENGIGALNLPYSKAEVGLDLARSVHPTSQQKISNWLSLILEKDFNIQNPFLFWTKAQMCKKAIENNAKSLLGYSFSCDRPARVKGSNVQHCGYCTSCLLRKNALLNSLESDPTKYAFTSFEKGKEFFEAINYQAEQMKQIFQSTNIWEEFCLKYIEILDYVNICNPPPRISNNILGLYQEHIHEWERFKQQAIQAS